MDIGLALLRHVADWSINGRPALENKKVVAAGIPLHLFGKGN